LNLVVWPAKYRAFKRGVHVSGKSSTRQEPHIP
jgi:hypothetical protein